MTMVFFDLDDTLLDHSAAAKAGATKVYETYRSSFKEDLEDFLLRWETVSEKYFQSNSPFLRLTTEERRRGRVREIFSHPLSEIEADARFQVYLDTYESRWELFTDSLPCLRSLKGRSLGLITNGEKEQHRSKIRKTNLGSYFSTVIISGEVGCAKPEQAIFELAAKQAGVPLADCVYVGDRLETDARSSQKAGMKGIWLDRKNRGAESGLEVPVIQSLMELPGLLPA
jgi:putative hydrolase of the HAD superfamily